MSAPLTRPSPVSAPQVAITRLTALWALAEAGLGGVLFALKIPLTGFLIGAVSTVLLSLIARFSNYSYRQIIGSTVTVLMVKAAASPHSPPPAYLAVAFQGLLAALLFSTLRARRAAPLLLGAISMAESALQKVIIMTLIFGKSLWEAVQSLAKEVARTFGIPGTHNYALWLIGGYLVLYAIWGLVVGAFAARIPQQIGAQKEAVLQDYFRKMEQVNASAHVPPQQRRRKERKGLFYAAVLVFIAVVFGISGAGSGRIAEIVLRSLAAIALLFFVLRPLLQWALRRWLRNRSGQERRQSEEVLQLLPTLRRYVPLAYTAAKKQPQFPKRLGSFLIILIILSLYAGNSSEDSPF